MLELILSFFWLPIFLWLWVLRLHYQREVIREADGTPYLVRYFIRLPKSKTKGRIYLHHILRSDHDRALHDHPWSFVSYLLRGRYLEVIDGNQTLPSGGWMEFHGTQKGTDKALAQVFHAGDRLVRPADWRHRLIIEEGKSVWSLVFTSPKQRSWGFWPNGKFCHWKKYDNALGICGE